MTIKNMVHVTLAPEEWDREDEVMKTAAEKMRGPVEEIAQRVMKGMASAKSAECRVPEGDACFWCANCDAAKLKVVADALRVERGAD